MAAVPRGSLSMNQVWRQSIEINQSRLVTQENSIRPLTNKMQAVELGDDIAMPARTPAKKGELSDERARIDLCSQRRASVGDAASRAGRRQERA